MDPDLLQPGMHIIWLDNLFTKIRLLEELRGVGIGAAGTVRPHWCDHTSRNTNGESEAKRRGQKGKGNA